MTEHSIKNSDDISFKELILTLKEWYYYFYKHWKSICIICILGGISGVFYSNYQKPIYTAKITFVLEEAKGSSSGLGGLASLAGQFGVDLGNSSGGGLLSGDNILLFFKSSSLAREVLLSKYDINTRKSIADEYSEVYGLKEKWSKNKKIGYINFPVLDSTQSYSRLQDSLLLEMIKMINTNQFSVSRTDKKAGFIDVSSNMQSELLSKVYCERIVQKVVERYINIKTKRQNSTVQKLQFRVDSISDLLKQKTFSGATLQNNSSTMDINPLYRTRNSVAVETTIRDKTLLATIFASVTQNLEMAKFTLSQETPVIQIVDTPLLPLKREKLSKIKSGLLCALLTTFLFLFWLVIKRYYVKAVKN